MAPDRHDGFYADVFESIKSVYDLTARIDERVKTIQKKQDEQDEKLDSFLKMQSELESRLRVLESNNTTELTTDMKDHEARLRLVEHSSERNENKWVKIAENGVQIIIMIIVAYLLFKMGISGP